MHKKQEKENRTQYASSMWLIGPRKNSVKVQVGSKNIYISMHYHKWNFIGFGELINDLVDAIEVE